MAGTSLSLSFTHIQTQTTHTRKEGTSSRSAPFSAIRFGVRIGSKRITAPLVSDTPRILRSDEADEMDDTMFFPCQPSGITDLKSKVGRRLEASHTQLMVEVNALYKSSESDTEVEKRPPTAASPSPCKTMFHSIYPWTSSNAITDGDDQIIQTNESHPALEYVPFYFLLQHCPWLLDRIRSVYALRWRVSYPLQRNVVLSRTVLRRFGISLTWGELLLLLPFYVAIAAGILCTVVIPSVVTTGQIARFALIAALVFCQRNSVVTLLLGVPFDRGLFYHKFAGRVAGITGLLHTVAFFIVDPKSRRIHDADLFRGAFTGQVNTSGSVLLLLILGIMISSLPQVRRQVFEVFYYLHVLFAAGMIACTFFHSGKLIPILALSTWGVDWFIRSVVMARTRYPRNASLKVMSESVVELRFAKTAGFCYNPGQYVYLAIPEISWLQWHPFSISSSPHQPLVTLHIRKAGNWTSALFDLANNNSTKDVSMLLEGPYGNLSVDIMGDRKYKSVLLISGGIGITPMQSICDHLLNEMDENRRQLRRIKFIWVERDPVLMEQTEFIKRRASTQTIDSADSFNVCCHNAPRKPSQPALLAIKLLTLPASQTTDEELEEYYASTDLLLDSDALNAIERIEVVEVHTATDAPIAAPATFDHSSILAHKTSIFCEGGLRRPVADELEQQVLDMQVYLTANSQSDIPFARSGRPNIKELFLDMKQETIDAGENRVAVCVSAPRKLLNLCRKACAVYSDSKVRFDFHAESVAL